MGKTIIITGANGALGSVVTSHLLNKGYQLIATVSSEEAVKQLPESNKLHAAAIDLTNEEYTEDLIRNSISEYKRIDGAVLLVGGFTAGNIIETNSADIKKQLALNFDTAYHIARPLFEHMLENNAGRLVFVGARPAIDPQSGKNVVAYALSKSLLFTLSEILNAEAKGRNVTATVVVPSTIDTPANRKNMAGINPDAWVKPVMLAEIIEFVLSDKSSALRETVLKVYNNS